MPLVSILRQLEGIITLGGQKEGGESKVRTLIWVIIILVIVAVLAYLLLGRGRRGL